MRVVVREQCGSESEFPGRAIVFLMGVDANVEMVIEGRSSGWRDKRRILAAQDVQRAYGGA
jgi:hypothetical protein